MSPRVTAIAVGALAIVAAVVWFTEFRDKGNTAAEAKPADKPDLAVFKFEEQGVRKLEVTRSGGGTMVAERNEQGEWTLQPSGQAADRSRLSSAMFRLSGLNASRRVAESADNLEQYGLASPALTVTVTQADGTIYTLLTGSRAPGEIGTYAKKPDNPTIYLVTTSFVNDLDRMVSEPPIAPTPVPTPSPSPEPSPTPAG